MKSKTAFTDDTRNRYIQLGCGQHPLPSPWENYDREVNIEQKLPFPSESARFIFAEHLIEHVPFTAGLAFLKECRRVLEPGGVLRLAFPDVTRFVELEGPRIEAYCDWLSLNGVAKAGVDDVFRHIIAGSGHRSIWTSDSCFAVLAACDFNEIREFEYGDSDLPALQTIERHHFSVPESVALAETTIIEATK